MTIRSNWVNWNSQDKCPLCGREGEDIANVYKKGHRRENGIILETGLCYCATCAGTPECEEHWENWFAKKWQECEEFAEENWEKFGVYTNVSGHYGQPSFYFGYAKTPQGLEPYLSMYPDCPRYKLEREIAELKFQWKKLGLVECRRQILEIVEASGIDYKDTIMQSVDTLFGVLQKTESAMEKTNESLL